MKFAVTTTVLLGLLVGVGLKFGKVGEKIDKYSLKLRLSLIEKMIKSGAVKETDQLGEVMDFLRDLINEKN